MQLNSEKDKKSKCLKMHWDTNVIYGGFFPSIYDDNIPNIPMHWF